MRKRKNIENQKDVEKKCPFSGEVCLQKECKLHHDEFGKCQFEVLVYNDYRNFRMLEEINKKMDQ